MQNLGLTYFPWPYSSLVEHSSDVNRSKKEMFYLTTYSTHCSYGYMASDIWYMTLSERGNPLNPL